MTACRPDQSERPPVTAMRVLDSGALVIGWEGPKGQDGQIARVDPDDGLRWTRSAGGTPYDLLPLADGVAVYAEQRIEHDKLRHVQLAVGPDAGTRWETVLVPTNALTAVLPTPRAIVSGPVVNDLVDIVGNSPDDHVTALIAVEPVTGGILARTRVRSSEVSPVALGSRTFLHEPGAGNAIVIDHNGIGPAAPIPGTERDPTIGCVAGTDYVVARAVADDLELTILRGGDPTQRTTTLVKSTPLPAACAGYGDKLVLQHEQPAKLRAVSRDGHSTEPLILGGRLADNTLARDHASSARSGPLTRFVPYLVTPRSAPDGHRDAELILVDLDRMSIAQRWTEHTRDEHVFRAGHHWYVQWDSRIAVIDGDTGKLGAAIEWGGSGFEQVTPRSIGGGYLWLSLLSWHHTKPTLACLDAVTLVPKSVSSEITIRDVRDDPRLAATPRPTR